MLRRRPSWRSLRRTMGCRQSIVSDALGDAPDGIWRISALYGWGAVRLVGVGVIRCRGLFLLVAASFRFPLGKR